MENVNLQGQLKSDNNILNQIFSSVIQAHPLEYQKLMPHQHDQIFFSSDFFGYEPTI